MRSWLITFNVTLDIINWRAGRVAWNMARARPNTRDKIATMFNILIIYSSKKDTLESVETKNIYRCVYIIIYYYNYI